MLNTVIFREYDIKCVVDKDLSKDNVELIGKAFGTVDEIQNLIMNRLDFKK